MTGPETASLTTDALNTLEDPKADPVAKATAKRMLAAFMEKEGGGNGPRLRLSDLPKFSGRRNSMDVVQFFFSLALVFQLFNVDDVTMKVVYATCALGPAIGWWISVGSKLYQMRKDKAENKNKCPYDLLQETLKQEYLDPHQQEKARHKLQSLRQENRSVSQLIEFFNQQLSLIAETIPDGTRKFWFRNGLHPEILRIMRPDCWESESFDQVVMHAMEAEKNFHFARGAYKPLTSSPYHSNDQPAPMELGRFYYGGRGRGPYGRGRGRGFGGRGFGGGRGRGRGATFNRIQQQQQPQRAEPPRPVPPPGAVNPWPCHECGSFNHFVKDCAQRQEKIRQQRLRDQQRLQRMRASQPPVFPPGFDPSKPSTSDFRTPPPPQHKTFAQLFDEEEN